MSYNSTTIIYVIWFLLPLFFFLLALWSFLEKIGGKPQSEKPSEAFRQGGFVLICVLLCILIDKFVLEPNVERLTWGWIPHLFFQFILLPIVLFICARIVGPSSPILISKAPHPSERKRKQSGDT